MIPANKLTTEQFITKSIIIHGDKYIYDKVIYQNSHTPVEIICRTHGNFFQKPNGHLSGNGCRKCYDDTVGQRCRSNTNEFLSKAKNIHGNIYDYSKVEYETNSKKVIIICSAHGEFYQTPNCHLAAQGCSKCGKIVSKSEIDWLNYIGIPNTKEYRQVMISLPQKISRKKYIIADGFDPKTNTIYEYLGDFWHGNPQIFNENDINTANNKTFGELYKDTINRETLLKNVGYEVISIWESEWEMQCQKKQQLSA